MTVGNPRRATFAFDQVIEYNIDLNASLKGFLICIDITPVAEEP